MALTQIKTSGIADDAVTLAKQAAGTDGQIITYDASGNPVAVGPGTDGQVLTSTGAGSPPAFEDIPAAGAALTGSTNNTITTVTGANAIQGEANLTFDGGALSQTIDANDEGINITASGAHAARFKVDSNQTGANDTIFFLSGRWNSTEVASIHFRTGADTTNKDDGRLTFHTTPSGGSLTERLRITEDGNVGINETSPQQQLHVHDDTIYNGVLINGNGAPRIAFARDTTTTGEWSAGVDGTNGTQFAITNSNNNDNRKLVISSTLTTLAQNTQINGDLSFGTAGDGIDFSIQTQSSSTTDDELLDHYEKGKWDPVVKKNGVANGTADVIHGRYVRVGKLVWLSCYCQWNSGSNSEGTSGGWQITGIPFSLQDDDPGTCRIYQSAPAGYWVVDGTDYFKLNTTRWQVNYNDKLDLYTGVSSADQAWTTGGFRVAFTGCFMLHE